MPKQEKKIRDKYLIKLKKFGRTVAKIRKQKGLTQMKLALATNLTLSYISKIECGKVNPSLIWLFAIADALDMNVTDFF